MHTEALIFDCDGTLTDSMPAHFVAWRTTLLRHGIVFEEDRFYELAGTPTSKIIELLASQQNVTVDVDEVTRQKADEFLQAIHLVEAIPQVADVVREHRGKMKNGRGQRWNATGGFVATAPDWHGGMVRCGSDRGRYEAA